MEIKGRQKCKVAELVFLCNACEEAFRGNVPSNLWTKKRESDLFGWKGPAIELLVVVIGIH